MIKRLVLFLFIFTICVSPRIPLGFIPGGRRLDLRIEDIIVAMLLLGWALYMSLKGRLYLTPIAKPLGFYLFISGLSTVFGTLVWGLNPMRASFYILKELQYFLIFLLVANWLKTPHELKYVTVLLLIGGLVNALWVGFQLWQGTYRPLFAIALTESYGEMGPPRFYGPALLGEYSPLATGGFFLIVFFVSLGLMVSVSNRYIRCCLIMFSGILFAALFSSLSRATIIGALFGILILLIILKRLSLLATMFVILPFILWFTQAIPVAGRVFNWGGFLYSLIQDRWEPIWQPLLHESYKGILLGFGKSSLGFLPSLISEEAHNYYLRALLEAGIFGFVTFLWLQLRIILLSVRMYRNSNLVISKALGIATLGATTALCLGAFFQDIFISVKVMEPFWILVGLMTSAYKIEVRMALSRS
jgi:hypothetical protein